MRISPLLLLVATAPFAGGFSPYLLANAGLTMPKTDIDDMDDDIDQEDLLGYSATVGMGFRSQLSPNLDFDGFAGFSMVSGGAKLEFEYVDEGYYYDPITYTSSYYDISRKNTLEATLFPKLLDLGAGVIFHATPKMAFGGGLVFSIPMGGTYEASEKYEVNSSCPSGATSCVPSRSESESDDGDIDDIMDDADTKVKSFVSFKLQGEYAVNDRLSLTAGWMLPMGDYISEEGSTVSWSRAVMGIKYSFSMPSANGSSTVSPSAAPQQTPAPAPEPTPAPQQ